MRMNISDVGLKKIGIIVLAMGCVLICGCSEEEDKDTAPNISNGGNTNFSPIVNRAGCHFSANANSNASEFACGLLTSLGDFSLDTQFDQEIRLQQQFFQDDAVVYPFNECDITQANAFSSPRNYILFGYYLTQKALSTYEDTLPLAVILAHEYGHQLQFKFGWQSENTDTARITELDADGWAGFYIAKTKRNLSSESSYAAAQQVIDIGDYNFSHPSHHGTPFERGTMYLAGFQIALEELETNTRYTFAQVHDRLTSYRLQMESLANRENPAIYSRSGKTTLMPNVDPELWAYIEKIKEDGVPVYGAPVFNQLNKYIQKL